MKSESSLDFCPAQQENVFIHFCNYEVKTVSYMIICLGYICGQSELLRFLLMCYEVLFTF